MIVKIILPQLQLIPLSYKYDGDDLEPGSLVVAPLRGTEKTGIVWELQESEDEWNASEVSKLKYITKKLDYPKLSARLLQFYERFASYNLASISSTIKMALPVEISRGRAANTEKQELRPENFKLPDLDEQQQQAIEQINEADKNAILLEGVTGSGKTEIYFAKIAEILKSTEGQVLVLLPEIALTQQIIERFVRRFGFSPAVWHSSIGMGRRKQILRGIITGDVKLVIGARSALLLPFRDLKLTIVDEEHDPSYKQETVVIYNARDMAVLRGYIESSQVILGSATPSVESVYNARHGKYSHVYLASRFAGASMPNTEIVDMKKQNLPSNKWLSEKLKQYMQSTLDQGNQVMLFLNRRGYAPLSLCRNCGYRFMCPNCSAWLVYHSSKNRLECHHCLYNMALINTCPSCKTEDKIVTCGPGVERIKEEVQYYFPEYKALMMSRDDSSSESELGDQLEEIASGEIDIIIGTQIITKGLHFPNLQLVGVIDADIGLMGGDLRATERTFQLLKQVSGRAGRESTGGEVILQSYYPDNVIINALKHGDRQSFINYELESRKQELMPPYAKLASILIEAKKEADAANIAAEVARAAPAYEKVSIYGPVVALMARINRYHRYRILIKSSKNFNLQNYIRDWLSSLKIPSRIKIKIDIDPQTIM
jgi:primosomal protein N' (replication factor Y)